MSIYGHLHPPYTPSYANLSAFSYQFFSKSSNKQINNKMLRTINDK